MACHILLQLSVPHTEHKFYFKDDGVCQGVTNSCSPPSQQIPKAPPMQQIPII